MPKRQVVTATLRDDLPKSHKKNKELIYKVEGVGQIYVRSSLFKPDTEPPTAFDLVVESDKPVWAEKGDHPHGGRTRGPGAAKKEYTPEEITKLEEKAKKTAARAEKANALLEKAKQRVKKSADGEDGKAQPEASAESKQMDEVLKS